MAKEELLAQFDCCPKCGDTRRMMETLGNELKEKGMIGDDLPVGLDEIGGPILDPRVADKVLIGGTTSGMFALRDVCLGCGEVYVVRIARKEVILRTGPLPGGPTKAPPNLERRRN